MAQEQAGIMGLAAPEQMPELPLEDSYDAMRQGLANARPDAAADLNETMATILPMLDQLSDEELDMLLQAIKTLYNDEENYEENVAELVRQGVLEEGDLPPTYDPEFLAALGAVVLEAKRMRQAAGSAGQMPMPPQAFAKGGIVEAARLVASKGRFGDTMLAHITPDEAKLLKSRGGSGTINPTTGLPEFFIGKIFKAIGSAFKSVVNAVKGVLKSPIGRVLGTVALGAFLGPAGVGLMSSTLAPVAASMGVTALSGGSVKDVLLSGATSYLGGANSPLTGYVGKAAQAMGITSPVATSAITTGLVGTGAGLLTGKNLKDSLKEGLTTAAISAGTQMLQNKIAPAKPAQPAEIEERSLMVGEEFAPGAQRIPPVSEVMQEITDQVPGAPSPATAPAAPMATSTAPVPVAQTAAGLPSSTAAPVSVTPAASGLPSSTLPSLPKTPTIMESLSDIKEGNITRGLGDLFMPSAPNPQQITGSREFADMVSKGVSPDKALSLLTEQNTPGILRTYGPATAAGITALGLAGGFNQNQPESEMKNQLQQPIDLSGNPSAYFVQNLPGVQYSQTGAITGTTAMPAMPTLSSVRVPGVSYNRPTYMAEGGIAGLAQGGYPRRTGQISGPGTETSDSVPAMLSDGEFVMTARAVRGMGGGSRREGAKRMYALMNQLERNAARG